jgi:hypothetical protein
MHRKTVGLDDAFWCARVGTKAVPTLRSNNVSAYGAVPTLPDVVRWFLGGRRFSCLLGCGVMSRPNRVGIAHFLSNDEWWNRAMQQRYLPSRALPDCDECSQRGKKNHLRF